MFVHLLFIYSVHVICDDDDVILSQNPRHCSAAFIFISHVFFCANKNALRMLFTLDVSFLVRWFSVSRYCQTVPVLCACIGKRQWQPMLPFSFCRRRFNYATDRRTMTSSQSSSSSSSSSAHNEATEYLVSLSFAVCHHYSHRTFVSLSCATRLPCHSESIYTRAHSHTPNTSNTKYSHIWVYHFSYSSHQLPQNRRTIFSVCCCHWQWHISILFIYLFSRFLIIVASRFVSITIKGEHIYTRVAV